MTIQITGASDLSVQLNSQRTIYPRHAPQYATGVFGSEFYDNLSEPIVVSTTVPNEIVLGSTGSITWTFDKEVAISDIRIVTWTTGTFQMIAS